jgi:GNAT superfamily N-acetyltransferase
MSHVRIDIVPYDFARHGDGPKRVVIDAWIPYGYEFSEEFDTDIVRPDLAYPLGFVVGEQDGRVVGCIGISDDGYGTYHLNRLYVRQDARRQGLGGRLVDWVIDEARRHGGTRLILFSDIAFEDAHRLYRSKGFRCTRFRYAPDAWASREWGFEMEL